MKKKLLSILLSVFMAMTLAPVSVLAEDSYVLGGTVVTVTNATTIDNTSTDGSLLLIFNDTDNNATIKLEGYAANADILLVGGGGAGGCASSTTNSGGGGGGGQVFEITETNLEIGEYEIVVGKGGMPTDTSGANGSPSKISKKCEDIPLFYALGGGGGGAPKSDGNGGETVATGGGAGSGQIVQGVYSIGGVGTLGEEGKGGKTISNSYSGGGGGAGGPGSDSTTSEAGDGGQGLNSSITGTETTYGGGGGGGAMSTTAAYAGSGGTGGGGAGGSRNVPAESGTLSLGGGGGGCGYKNTGTGGAGGSGTVIVRIYPSEPLEPKTIVDILPTGFPTDYNTGWVIEDNTCARVFKNGEKLCFNNNDEFNYSINLNEALTFENNNYKYTSTYMDGSKECTLVCSFAMNGETLSYIKLDLGTNLYQEVQGYYVESVTVKFNMNGHGTQVPDQVIRIGTTATEPTNPTADGYIFDGWYSSANFEGSPFNFDTSITKELIGDGRTITLYAKWIKTIANILNTVDGGFPTTKESGWVSDAKHLYLNDTSLYVADVGSVAGTSQDLKAIQGTNDYKYEVGYGGIVITFEMDSNDKLEKITITGDEGYNGEYVPYQYTNDPITKPVGYTGELEFITNGKYIDQSTTPVTVSIDEQPISEENYTVTDGSTHVKLKGSYVSTLGVGTHTIKIAMDGYSDITSEFTITATPSPSPTPKTGYVAPKTGVE